MALTGVLPAESGENLVSCSTAEEDMSQQVISLLGDFTFSCFFRSVIQQVLPQKMFSPEEDVFQVISYQLDFNFPAEKVSQVNLSQVQV